MKVQITKVRYSEGGSGVGEIEGRLAHGEASIVAQSSLGKNMKYVGKRYNFV